MTKILTLFILTTIILSAPSVALAGPGHDHSHDHGHSHEEESTKKDLEIITAATKGVSAIITQKHPIEGKELSSNWGKIPESAKSISKRGNGYFIVKFNDAEANQNLFVLVSDKGELYDANFSGTFEGLEKK